MLERFPGSAGTDEAGRGPLAGPVVAAAVILPEAFDITGLNDSKKLDFSSRAELEIRILAEAVWAIEFAWPDEIEEKNILHASLAAMSRALKKLPIAPTQIFVDGNRLPLDLRAPAVAVIKGDGKIAEIAAASILAKMARDRHMTEMEIEYPGYGFATHFGYPTPQHFAALNELGPCKIHRKGFAPVAALMNPTLF
jgi:ribonuclease HII